MLSLSPFSNPSPLRPFFLSLSLSLFIQQSLASFCTGHVINGGFNGLPTVIESDMTTTTGEQMQRTEGWWVRCGGDGGAGGGGGYRMVDGGGLCFRVPMFCSAMRKHPAAAVPTRASLCYNHTCTHCTHAAATLMSPQTHTHTQSNTALTQHKLPTGLDNAVLFTSHKHTGVRFTQGKCSTKNTGCQ